MGMTDKQFSGYLRILLDYLEEVDAEKDEEKKKEKFKKIMKHIRDTIED